VNDRRAAMAHEPFLPRAGRGVASDMFHVKREAVSDQQRQPGVRAMLVVRLPISYSRYQRLTSVSRETSLNSRVAGAVVAAVR
jgi:hypothetical protein